MGAGSGLDDRCDKLLTADRSDPKGSSIRSPETDASSDDNWRFS